MKQCKPPFRPGDIVVVRYPRAGYDRKLLTVESCVISVKCESGWLVTTHPNRCTHCGHVLPALVEFDSGWFKPRRRIAR